LAGRVFIPFDRLDRIRLHFWIFHSRLAVWHSAQRIQFALTKSAKKSWRHSRHCHFFPCSFHSLLQNLVRRFNIILLYYCISCYIDLISCYIDIIYVYYICMSAVWLWPIEK